MKKYLVVINYCEEDYFEEETYLFNTKKDMLDFFNVKSIKELLKESSFSFSYTVYELSNVWGDD